MRALPISTSDRSALIHRATHLVDVMLDDPARPWFLVEYAVLLLEVAETLDLVLDTVGNSNELSDRLSSLETRYSELLYCLKTK